MQRHVLLTYRVGAKLRWKNHGPLDCWDLA